MARPIRFIISAILTMNIYGVSVSILNPSMLTRGIHPITITMETAHTRWTNISTGMQ